MPCRIIAILSIVFWISSPLFAQDAEEREALAIIQSLGCRGCHVIGGKGGTVGPSLDGIGRSRDRTNILSLLENPRETNPSATMPSFRQIPMEDLERIADDLAGRK